MNLQRGLGPLAELQQTETSFPHSQIHADYRQAAVVSIQSIINIKIKFKTNQSTSVSVFVYYRIVAFFLERATGCYSWRRGQLGGCVAPI